MILDPIYTILVCLLVICSTFGLAGETFRTLIEATPPNINLNKLKNKLYKINDLEEVMDLHVWEMAQGKPALMVKLYAN